MISHFNSGQSGSYVILISLLTNYADHLFTCLSVVHIPYDVKYMFRYFFIIALVSMQCCPGSRCYRMRTLFLFLFFCFRHLFINSTIQSTWVKWIPTKFQALGIWWSMEFCICSSSMYKKLSAKIQCNYNVFLLITLQFMIHLYGWFS